MLREISYAHLEYVPNIHMMNVFTKPYRMICACDNRGCFSSIHLVFDKSFPTQTVFHGQLALATDNHRIVAMHLIYESPQNVLIAASIVVDTNVQISSQINFYVTDGMFENWKVILNPKKSMTIQYIPYLTKFCRILADGFSWADEKSVVNDKHLYLLVCGGDGKIHLYKQKKNLIWNECSLINVCKPLTMFTEDVLINFHFSDLSDEAANVQCFYGTYKALRMTIVFFNKQSFDTLKVYENRVDAIITSVSLIRSNKTKDISDVHLVSADALNSGIQIFRNIYENGFNDGTRFPNILKGNIPTASCMIDFDVDGETEIVIGYGEGDLLIMKISTEKLICCYKLPSTVYSVQAADITNDGVLELCVLSKLGIHILQRNIKPIPELLRDRLITYVK